MHVTSWYKDSLCSYIKPKGCCNRKSTKVTCCVPEGSHISPNTLYEQCLFSVHYETHYVESHSDLINIIFALLDYWLYPVVLAQDASVLLFPLVWVKVFSVNQQLVFLWLCLRNSVCLLNYDQHAFSCSDHFLRLLYKIVKRVVSPKDLQEQRLLSVLTVSIQIFWQPLLNPGSSRRSWHHCFSRADSW